VAFLAVKISGAMLPSPCGSLRLLDPHDACQSPNRQRN